MTADRDDDTIKAVTLNRTDTELVWMASRLLLGLPDRPTCMEAVERLIQHYRDDIGDAHDGTDPDTLDDMATSFGGALMLRMLRMAEDDDAGEEDTPPPRGAPELVRRRVLEEIGRLLKAVDPRH